MKAANRSQSLAPCGGSTSTPKGLPFPMASRYSGLSIARAPPSASATSAGPSRALRAAMRAGLQVVIDYEPPARPAAERVLHPHGLVCKRGVWYLVATTEAGFRTYRISRVRSVRVTDDAVDRPADFDLADVWTAVQRDLLSRLPEPVVVEADVEKASLRRLHATIGNWWHVDQGPTDDRGYRRVTIRFATAAGAASELVGLADHIRVISPDQVIAEMARIGDRLVERYGRRSEVTR